MSTFGEELRRERELRRISLREISESTKISLRHLEALERNDFQHLPGGVFNRGFVRAYSQFIGVDPETMVNAYLLEEQAQVGREPDADPPGRRALRATEPARSPARHRPRWGVLLLWSTLLILIGALVATVYLVILRNGDAPASSGAAVSRIAHGGLGD